MEPNFLLITLLKKNIGVEHTLLFTLHHVLLQRCQQDANKGKFKLRDILSVPMQRILKYHLLLDKLISDTQPVSIHCYLLIGR